MLDTTIVPLHTRSALVPLAAEHYRLAGQDVSAHALALLALGVTLCAVLPRRAWRLGRLVVTSVHEIGHATAAVLVGRNVTAIHLRSDASGVTYHFGSRGRRGSLLTALAGYPAPGLIAVGGAWLAAHRQSGAWLTILAALATISVLLWVRNAFGIMLVTGAAAALIWLLVSGTAGPDAAVATVLVWFLAVGGLRSAATLWNQSGPSDATDVAQLTRLPVGLCKFGFLVVAATAVAACAGLLFGWL